MEVTTARTSRSIWPFDRGGMVVDNLTSTGTVTELRRRVRISTVSSFRPARPDGRNRHRHRKIRSGFSSTRNRHLHRSGRSSSPLADGRRLFPRYRTGTHPSNRRNALNRATPGGPSCDRSRSGSHGRVRLARSASRRRSHHWGALRAVPPPARVRACESSISS